jgi:hypothetical protein
MIRGALRGVIDRAECERSHNAGDKRDVFDTGLGARWMVSRVTGLLIGLALVSGFGLAAPVAGQESNQPATVKVYTMTPERIAASTAVVVALIGAVIGARVLARGARGIGTAWGRRGAIVALVLGPIGLIIGGLVVATADGGLGTGNGLAGGIVAMMVGLVGIILGGLALARSRRTA